MTRLTDIAPRRRYATLVADPPWSQKAGPPLPVTEAAWSERTDRRSRDHAYPAMTIAEIAALPVGEVAAADAHLYLWATNRYLPYAFDVVHAWGFAYSTTLVWAKRPLGGGLGGAYGISTEFLLFARRGRLPAIGRVRGTWHHWKRPYDERGKPRSSAKPPEAMAMVETVSPGPYLELFAREHRPGWDAWGNEVESTVELGAAA